MRFIENVLAWAAAALVTYGAACVFSTQFVLAINVGAVPFSVRWDSAVFDLLHMWQYGTVLAGALLIGFVVASLVKAMVPILAPVAYPVAGASVVAAVLGVMVMQYGQMPISGAVTDWGYGFQLLAGALGGLVFETLRPKANA